MLQGTTRITVENPSAHEVAVASLVPYRLLRVRSVRGYRDEIFAFDQTIVSLDDFEKPHINQFRVTLAEP